MSAFPIVLVRYPLLRVLYPTLQVLTLSVIMHQMPHARSEAARGGRHKAPFWRASRQGCCGLTAVDCSPDDPRQGAPAHARHP